MDTLTRRQLLVGAASAAGAGVLSLWYGGDAGAQSNPLLPDSGNTQRFAFFTQPEIVFVDAALDRLIPADHLGPGAREAGVTWFIDQQLAGPFGRADRWYMQGPWKQGADEQGYQSKLTPAQLYRAAIRNIDEFCRNKFSGKVFAQLGADRDKILHGLEAGEIELAEAPAKDFFEILWQNAQEGFLADPMYGGNRNFAGWKLIGFPGPRYNYVEEIEKYGKRYTLPTVGLTGRGGAVRQRSS